MNYLVPCGTKGDMPAKLLMSTGLIGGVGVPSVCPLTLLLWALDGGRPLMLMRSFSEICISPTHHTLCQ
jgi:hypothetical protein